MPAHRVVHRGPGIWPGAQGVGGSSVCHPFWKCLDGSCKWWLQLLPLHMRYLFFVLAFSEYPVQRSKKDSEGIEMGVAGSVSLLQNVTLSTQPISSLDWSPDKRGLCICSSFDQMVRVLIITKLNKI